MWANMITALITAAATLTGVGITQAFAAKMSRLNRTEGRRVEQRAMLVEVLASGHDWSKALDQVGYAAAMLDRATLYKFPEFQQYQTVKKTHDRALLTARLAVRDEEIRARLKTLSAYDLTCRSAYDLTCWFAGVLAG